MRRSLSIHRLRQRDQASVPASNRSNQDHFRDAAAHCQSSLDPFVIHGRTRYPSSQCRLPPEHLDLHIAQALLDTQQADRIDEASQWHLHRNGKFNQMAAGETPFGRSEPTIPPCGLRFEGAVDSRQNPRECSGQSSLAFSERLQWQSQTGSEPSSTANTTNYALAYNQLAAQNGLRNLEELSSSNLTQFEAKGGNTSIQKSAKQASKNWFLNKLSRNTSSKDLRRSSSRISRKNSLSSLLTPRPKVCLKAQSLDDICRLGGIGFLELPPKYKPVRLEMPNCLAATGNYLVAYCTSVRNRIDVLVFTVAYCKLGRDTPGIFRIPGQTTITNALYDYYMSRISEAESLGRVEVTIGSLCLPHGLCPSVHDVASVFKKFLWDLPGGILGSPALFEALKEICALPVSEQSLPNRGVTDGGDSARLVALAIFSLNSNKRISLICAVFGLLAFLKRDKDDTSAYSASRQLGTESMGSKAFGVIFAPILLGNIANEADASVGLVNDLASVAPKRSFLGPMRASKPILEAKRSSEVARGFERAKTCASVAEKLIRDWEAVVVEMSALTGAKPAARQYDEELQQRTWNTENMRENLQLPAHQSLLGLAEKSTHTPSPATAAHEFRPLPYPPTPSLHFDPALHRSASISVMQNHSNSRHQGPSQNSGPIGKLARCNTALHLSDPVGTAVKGHHTNRMPKLAPHVDFPAWWEDNSPTRQREERRVNCPPVSFKQDVEAIQEPLKHVVEPWSPAAIASVELDPVGAPQQVPTRNQECLDRSVLSLRSTSIDRKSRERLNIQDESLEIMDSNDDTLIDPVVYETQIAVSPPRIMEIESHDGAVTRCDNTPMARGFKASPSMIPRPVYPSSRSRKLHSSASESPTEKVAIRMPHRTPVSPARMEVGNDSLLLTRYQTRSAQEPRRHMHRNLPLRSSNSADRRPATTQVSPMTHLRIQENSVPEQTIARVLDFRPSTKTNIQKMPSSSTISHQDSPRQGGRRKANVGTLYAEIRRLNSQLNSKDNEIAQLRHQLDAVKRSRGSGTLSEKLLETELNTTMWSVAPRSQIKENMKAHGR